MLDPLQVVGNQLGKPMGSPRYNFMIDAPIHPFTFDKEKHIYRLGTMILPHITEIIRDNGWIDSQWYTEEARSRGQAVHHARNLFDQGKLRLDTLHPDLHGYLQSWRKIKEHYKFIILVSETPLYHKRLLYAGTPDCLVQINNALWVIDCKTGVREAWHAYQTAAQEALLLSKFNCGRRFSAYLHADGSEGTLIEHTDYSDFSVFCAMLLCTRRREQDRIKPLCD